VSLSSYELLAVDESGKSASGTLTTPHGITAEVYKNWVYVGDPKAWRKDGSFEKPVVMQVWSGHLVYGDLHLLVVRGPQYGAYVVAYYRGRGGEVRGMVACGVYAYAGSRYVGLKERSLAWWARERSRSREVVTCHWDVRTVKKEHVLQKVRTVEVERKYEDVPEVFREVKLRRRVRLEGGRSRSRKELERRLAERSAGLFAAGTRRSRFLESVGELDGGRGGRAH